MVTPTTRFHKAGRYISNEVGVEKIIQVTLLACGHIAVCRLGAVKVDSLEVVVAVSAFT